LKDDKDVKNLLPCILYTQNDNPDRTDGKIDLFEALKSGVLLAKLINDAIPGAIDESLIIPNPKIAVHMYENHSLVLEAAKRYGLQLWNIGPQDIMRGIPHLCLGLVWQIIKIGLFKKVDMERKKLALTEKSLSALPAEELVLRWFNDILQITNKTSKRVAQWSLDLRDSICYTIVLQYLGSIAKEEFHGQSANFIPEEEQDWLKRAERMLSMAEKLGCRKFLTPVDVVNGNKNLNIAFTVNLFNTFASRTFTQTLNKVHKDAINMSRDINFNALPPEPTSPLIIDAMSSESLALRENLNKSLVEIENLKKEKAKINSDMDFLQRDYNSLKKRMDPILDEVKTLRYQKDDLEKQYEDMKEENKETQQRCTELEKIVHRARLVQTLKNQLEEKEAIIASGLNNNNESVQNVQESSIKKYPVASDLVHCSRIEEELEQCKERISELEDQLQQSNEELAKVKNESKEVLNNNDYYNTPPTSPPFKELDESKMIYSLQEILESNRQFDRKNPEELTKRVYWLCECLSICQNVMGSLNNNDNRNVKFPAPPKSITINDNSEKQIISNLMEERDDTLKKQHQLERELSNIKDRYVSLAKEHEKLLIDHNNILSQGKLTESKKEEEVNNTIKLLKQQFYNNNSELNKQLEEKNVMIQKYSIILDEKENTLKQYNRDMRSKDKKIKDLNKQFENMVSEKSREIENLRKTINSLTNENDNLIKVNHQYQTELQTVKDDLKKEQIRSTVNTPTSNVQSVLDKRSGRASPSPNAQSILENRSGRASPSPNVQSILEKISGRASPSPNAQSILEKRSGRSSPSVNNTQIMERINKMRSEVDAMRKKLKNKSNNDFSI